MSLSNPYHQFFTARLLFRLALAGIASITIVSLPVTASGRRSDAVPGPIPAKVVEVIDGDSIKVRAYIWLGNEVETTVRVRGIDTPEIKGKCDSERAMAGRARNLAEELAGERVHLTDVVNDKYGGRVTADVVTERGDLAREMIRSGLARPYSGGRRDGWCGRQ